ncbi:MAG: MMPL family transporter [Cycloclasticus sp.]|nr:MMPL family transporter [Cycloclasticus sp.]
MSCLAAYQATKFRLDASADTLVLENDQALEYYRSIKARYGSDDYLIITYTPEQDLFSEPVLADIQSLRYELSNIENVASVVTILDVPLIEGHDITVLENPETDRDDARRELTNSPIYQNLVISSDAKTTALQVNLKRDDTWHRLLRERNQLREKRLLGDISPADKKELVAVSQQFETYSSTLQDQQNQDIASIRAIMHKHKRHAELFLGGVPMITADSIDFVRHDIVVFGIGVICFLLIILSVAFGQLRWVVFPTLTCLITGLITIGFLGYADWPVTVVSSNFISLLLIITLSLTVHLVVRYRELHQQSPNASQNQLVLDTVKSKVLPCFYTAITTMVAFGSLLVSGIRPVIDFGWMMAVGITISFLVTFTLFPALLVLLQPKQPKQRRDITGAITQFFARQIELHGGGLLATFFIVIALSLVGISSLSVENRFIDYYKESTEIYQGMQLIDRKLGGTTPLEVIIDSPTEAPLEQEEEVILDDEDLEALEFEDAGITGRSYWFNSFMAERVAAIHDYLDSLPETGKVLSISSSLRMLERLNEQAVVDDFFLSVLYKKLPDEIKAALFTPYLSEDGDQIRFTIRVFESDATLKREALLQKIRTHLTTELNLQDEQVHLTGMVVLYNNMLQSLFRSQILTIGVVFIAILLMFIILFRNLKMAAIALIPNLTAAALVLGLMGWLRIPLDIMTITIAAISIGIAVDDTIHYVHRVTLEYQKDNDYWGAVRRSHRSIGRAMYYTTITITLGFSILTLSNFIPTIYFGLLTGFSMVVALLADLILLPLLIVRFKPL